MCTSQRLLEEMFLLLLLTVCNPLYSWGIYYNPALIPTPSEGWAAASALQHHLPVFIFSPRNISKYFRWNVMKCRLLSRAHVHLFIGPTLYFMSTQTSTICNFPSVLFLINSVAGVILKNMQGRLKYGHNPREQMKQCYLLLLPSVLKTWLARSDSHGIYYIWITAWQKTIWRRDSSMYCRETKYDLSQS